MFHYSKKYPYIVRLEDKDVNLIFKLSKSEDDIDSLKYEHQIYSLINHPAFKSYELLLEFNNVEYNDIITLDIYNKKYKLRVSQILIVDNYINLFPNKKFNIIVGKYNKNTITLYNFYKNTYNCDIIIKFYRNILNITEKCFNEYNFIHGDLNSNNILLKQTPNIYTPSNIFKSTTNLIDFVNDFDPFNQIQIIDFEFSLIFSSDQLIIEDENFPLINLYLKLKSKSIVTKDFARLFDIYSLCINLIYYSPINLFELKKSFDSISLINESNSFIDFYIIFSNLYIITKTTMSTSDDDYTYLIITYDSIIKNLLNIHTLGTTDKLQSRIDHINSVLKIMQDLNANI